MRNSRVLPVIIALVLAMLSPIMPAQAASLSLIDAQRTATLRIEKSAGDPLTQFGDPTNPAASTTREPLQGIEFSVRQVQGVDLTTSAGWQEAEALQEWQFYAGGDKEATLGEARTAVTGADGVATFADLPLGLYYVTENHKTAQAQNLSLVAPFLVALPATNAAGTGWDYDVSVHAKDQLINATKQADRKCAAVGDVVEYGITGSLPAPDRDSRISSFSIADPLAAGQEFLSDSSSVFIADVHRPDATIRLEQKDYQVQVVDSVPMLSLTESGLAKAAQQRLGNPGASVTWKFKVRLTEKVDPLRNRGYVIPPGYPEFNRETTPGVPTNETIIRMPCKTPGVIIPIPVPVPDPNNPTPHQPTPETPNPENPTPENPTLGNPETPSDKSTFRDRLANTGASVLWLVGIAVLVIAFGLFLTSRRKEEEA